MRAITATAAIIAALATPLAAQQNCAPHEVVVERLYEKYGERLAFEGLGSSTLMQLFVNPDKGTWSIVSLTPSKMGCLMTHGTHATHIETIEGEKS